MRGIPEERLKVIAAMPASVFEAPASEIINYLIAKECQELQEPWITIDSARKDGTRYLLFNIFWEAPCTGLFDGRQWVLHSDLPPFKNQPTHYQELPIHKPEPLR